MVAAVLGGLPPEDAVAAGLAGAAIFTYLGYVEERAGRTPGLCHAATDMARGLRATARVLRDAPAPPDSPAETPTAASADSVPPCGCLTCEKARERAGWGSL
jgi:hypothetical protein